jgi:hypothetical protein
MNISASRWGPKGEPNTPTVARNVIAKFVRSQGTQSRSALIVLTEFETRYFFLRALFKYKEIEFTHYTHPHYTPHTLC